MALSRDEFFTEAKQLIADPHVKSIGVVVTLPGGAEPELIVTDSATFAQKLFYYETAYNDHMELRVNVLKRITGIVPFRIDVLTITANTAQYGLRPAHT